MEHDINTLGTRALDLINEVNNCTPLLELLSGEICGSAWRDETNHLPEYINYGMGETRIVFWDNNKCDYVFKINFTDNYKDYGGDEAFLYKKAKELGIESCFAWTAKVAEWEDIDIYAMEYCNISDMDNSDNSYFYHRERFCNENGWDIDNLTDKEQEIVSRNCNHYNCGSHDGMIDFAGSQWEEYKYNTFLSMVDHYGMNDLHSGNWGYRDNGDFVLTDYAGYESIIVRD